MWFSRFLTASQAINRKGPSLSEYLSPKRLPWDSIHKQSTKKASHDVAERLFFTS